MGTDSAENEVISIHVPLAGHDANLTDILSYIEQISIHVPLAGHDRAYQTAKAVLIRFQSTCPLRGTTIGKAQREIQSQFQSTCPLRGTTRSLYCW